MVTATDAESRQPEPITFAEWAQECTTKTNAPTGDELKQAEGAVEAAKEVVATNASDSPAASAELAAKLRSAENTARTRYAVRERPGKEDADAESKRGHKPARWAISDKVDFDGAVVGGADFEGVTFLNGFTAKGARFEGGASFKVRGACPCVGTGVH